MAAADSTSTKRRGNPTQQPTGRAAPSDDLSGRVYGSGLIQPGAHPEMDRDDTPWDKLTGWIDKTFGTRHKPMPKPK